MLLDVMGMAFSQGENRRNRKFAQHQFDQVMDHSIRRRVNDAERAGIHPLFALGGNVGASPTAAFGGGDARNPLEGASARLAARDTMKASAARDYAEAAYYDALTARVSQDKESQGRDRPDTGSLPRTIPGPAELGPHFVEPTMIPASRPDAAHVTAGGAIPAYTTVKGAYGEYRVPNPDFFDDLGMPAAIEFFRQEAKGWLSGRMSEIGEWRRVLKGTTGAAELARIEKQLDALRNDRLLNDGEKARGYAELKARALRIYQEYKAKFGNLGGK